MALFIAPVVTGIFPLVNKDGLQEKAKEIYNALKENISCFYDEDGSIGRRYRRIDEAGVPFAITIDYDTLKDNTVTVRECDSMKQKRVKISELAKNLR